MHEESVKICSCGTNVSDWQTPENKAEIILVILIFQANAYIDFYCGHPNKYF